MKKIALSLAALALTAGSALAADLPSRKGPPVLPPPPPPPLWTGLYVGANIGYNWSNSNTITTAAIAGPCNPASGGGCALNPNYSLLSAVGASGVINSEISGVIGGGQVGYNYQFNNFVGGLEVDFQGIGGGNQAGVLAAVVPSQNFPAQPHVSVSSATRSLSYIGTVRGRVGWLAMPTLLVYATGGFAFGEANLAYNVAQTCIGCAWTIPPLSTGSTSSVLPGWTAGAGLEWMFWPNWSAKVEYLYYDLGTARLNTAIIGTNPANGPLFLSSFPQTSSRFNGNIVRVGLNYHFNWGAPAPVVAKY
jgi:outer membrane immunogenic protein